VNHHHLILLRRVQEQLSLLGVQLFLQLEPLETSELEWMRTFSLSHSLFLVRR
jgi:hypothetical protein